jgi:hypothetical protein
MSQLTASAGHGAVEHGHTAHADLSAANITLDPAKGRPLWMILLVIGLVGLGITAVVGITNKDLMKQALAAYHIGAMATLAMSLGALFFILIFHLTGAGWSVTIRRQFENVASLVWLPALLAFLTFFIEVFTGGHLYAWLNKGVSGNDELLHAKAAYLNPIFFGVRGALYFCVWTYLAWRMWTYSTEQDKTGDKWLTNKARFTSSWGMPILALTTAFAAFDWLKSMDYRFFSTMWGVYYFAGAGFCSIPVIVILLTHIRGQGKLKGLVTEEHYHDLAKIMFVFVVFWAYIGFSQYFLIWYADIPEETSFMIARKVAGWQAWTKLLMFGHFVAPFYIMLWRPIRRSPFLLSILGVWFIFMQVADMVWIVRPMVYSNEIGEYLRQLDNGTPTADPIKLKYLWLDVAGIVGVLGVYFAFVVKKVYSGQLVPTRDPRLAEAVGHKNYV